LLKANGIIKALTKEIIMSEPEKPIHIDDEEIKGMGEGPAEEIKE